MKERGAGDIFKEVLESFPLFSGSETVAQALERLEMENLPLAILPLKEGWACVSLKTLTGVPPTRLLKDARLKPLVEVRSGISLASLLEEMERSGAEVVAVVDDSQLQGIVRREKVLERLLAAERELRREEERRRILAEVYQALAKRRPGEALSPALEVLSHYIPFDCAGFLWWVPGMSGFKGTIQWTRPGYDPRPMFTELYGTGGEPGTMPLGANSYVDAVTETGQHLYVPDTAKSNFWGDAARARHGIRSSLAYPLILRDDFKAVLIMHSRSPDAFDESHITLLSSLAPILAAVLESYRLFRELQELNATLEKRVQQRTFELQVLYELTQQISYALDYDELFRLILQHIHRVVDYDVAGSLLVTDDRCEMFIKKDRPLTPELESWIRKRMLDTFRDLSGSEVPEERLELITLETESYNPQARPLERLRSTFNVPLIVDNHAIGLLFVGAEEENAFGEEHLRVLFTLSSQAAISIQRLRALLAAEQTRLEAAIQSMREGVVLLDEEGRIVVANPRARELLPLLTEAHLGETLSGLGKVGLEDILALTRKGRHREIVVEGPKNRVFEVTAAPFRTAGGEREGTVLVIDEVTEEREIQKRLQQQERLAVVGQLAGGIAHDFNNILTSILGFAQLGLKSVPPDSPAYNYFETIRAQGKRAAQLVQQMLDFSRRSVTQKGPLDLLPFLKEMTKLLERTIPENILIRLEARPGEYLVYADATQLQQVIMNLATNARDAMPEGGILTLRLEKIETDEDLLAKYPEMVPGKYIRLTVEDTGCGMPPDVLAHAFEPFFTTKPPGEGTGLGLAQVYGIVRQHNGYVYLESQVNEGTKAIVYLPALEITKVERKEKLEELPQGQGEKILVVEDEKTVLDVAQNMLESLGYQVLTATTGKEALEIYRQHKGEIALVLSDMVMPEMGGRELYQALREIDPDVKMLVVSGYSLNKEVAELRKLGLKGYIQKPFTLEDLAHKVRRALEE